MSGSYSWLHGAPQCIYLLFAQKYVLRFAEMIVCFNEKNCKLQNIFAALRIGKYLQHGAVVSVASGRAAVGENS